MATFTYLTTNTTNHFIVDSITKEDSSVVYGGLFVTGSSGASQLEDMVTQFLLDNPNGLERNIALEQAFGIGV